ncbi:MAG: glycosyltransferase, partial [Bacteroidales bacterium]|nr:glycosyltransferase [Bacteroidales bacterium]
LDRYSPSLYAATIVLTHADKLVMNNQNHHSKRIYVIPNPLTFVPVTIAENGKLKNVTGQELKKENIVLAAGRLNDWNCKGWDLLIQAAAKLKALFLKEGWRIEIAGGGTETMQMFLEKMCVQAGVEEFVQFLGYRTDMKELFQKSSVFCLSSRSEGLPMVLIEAMSQGCAPVACENLGRTKEIVSNDDEGLLFQTADVNDLARKLSQMIENNEYRKIVQRAAVRRSDFFNIEHVISIWETVLKDICKTS